MSDDERLFEVALSNLDTMAQPSARSAPLAQDRPALQSDLCLVEAIHDVEIPVAELRGARERVASLLWEEMAASAAPTLADDVTPTVLTSPSATAPAPVNHRRPTRKRRLARAALAAAAILLIGCVAGWQMSDAASAALPGSPLYGLKRGEESLALNLAWSDQRRGEVLATIADHRLTEMGVEAQQQNNSLVRSLAVEFDGTMRQLIALTATMTERHEDTTIVASDLAHELTREYATLHTAQENGNVVLAQALTVTTQSETTAISNSHIHLPPGAMSTPTSGATSPGVTPTDGSPTTTGQGRGHTHSPPTPSTSPTPPGNNGGNPGGNGNGNGNGNSNGNGGLGGGNSGHGGGHHGGIGF